MKTDRELIFNMYGGKCAYCGCQLKKGWHISKLLPENVMIGEKGAIDISNDTIENKLPSCASCNMARTRDNGGVTHISIEDFRKQIIENLEFIQSFSYYQRAVRFVQIIETNKPVVFYFEILTTSDKNKP